ncbi:MAG: hypothetical protein ABR568_19265 [Pyrinomonadaceae bacterium]
MISWIESFAHSQAAIHEITRNITNKDALFIFNKDALLFLDETANMAGTL